MGVDDAAILLVLWAGKGILARAGDDFLNSAYADVKATGRTLLKRLLDDVESGDEEAAQAAVVEFAAHLEVSPEESAAIIQATVRVLSTEPLDLFEATLRIMVETAASLETIPWGGKTGCAAFAGSFPNPRMATVLDIRDWDRRMQQPPQRESPFGGEPRLQFHTSGGFPRMWILEVANGRGAEQIAAELNSALFDKHDNPDRFAPLKLEGELVAAQGSGRIWQVEAIFGDRVEIYYPGQDQEREAKLAATQSIFDPLPETALDRRRRTERRLFDIADSTGPQSLVAHAAALRSSNNERRSSREDQLSRLANEVAKAMAKESG